MITVGSCLISIITSTMFKVVEVNYHEGIYIMPYSRVTKTWETNTIGRISPSGIDYYKPIACPRSRNI